MPGDIGEVLRAQPVGERMRRVLVEMGGGEEIGHLSFKPGHSTGAKERRPGAVKVKKAIEDLAKF